MSFWSDRCSRCRAEASNLSCGINHQHPKCAKTNTITFNGVHKHLVSSSCFTAMIYVYTALWRALNFCFQLHLFVRNRYHWTSHANIPSCVLSDVNGVGHRARTRNHARLGCTMFLGHPSLTSWWLFIGCCFKRKNFVRFNPPNCEKEISVCQDPTEIKRQTIYVNRNHVQPRGTTPNMKYANHAVILKI